MQARLPFVSEQITESQIDKLMNKDNLMLHKFMQSEDDSNANDGQ